MLGAALYLVCLDAKTKEPYSNSEPCRICKRFIINAGINKVIARVTRNRFKTYHVRNWIDNNLWEYRKRGRKIVPVEAPRTLSEAVDIIRAKKLINHFSLADALVVQLRSGEMAKQAIGRVAARYFFNNVKNMNSVALSCGDTILSMLEHLPYQPHLQLVINQLSIEGDPSMIHQAPATLVGLLRAKSSPKSKVFGLQLPPRNMFKIPYKVEQDEFNPRLIKKLWAEARCSEYAFLGVGSAASDSASFWAMAQSATEGRFSKIAKKIGIIGEINNQVFNENGEDCSHLIPGFDSHVVNILKLTDLKSMAKDRSKQKVVLVATGESKTKALRTALKYGFANVIITSREDADRLLEKE